MRKILLLTFFLLIPVTLSSESLFGVHGGFAAAHFSHTGEDGEDDVTTEDRGVNLSLDYDAFVIRNLALHAGVDFDLSTVTYIDGVKNSSFPGFVLKAGLVCKAGPLKLSAGIHYRILNGEENGERNSARALLLYINSSIVIGPHSPFLVLGIEYGYPLSASLVKAGETKRKLKLRNSVLDTGSLYIYGGIEYTL